MCKLLMLLRRVAGGMCPLYPYMHLPHESGWVHYTCLHWRRKAEAMAALASMGIAESN